MSSIEMIKNNYYVDIENYNNYQVGDITTIPMRCIIIIQHMRQVYNRCKIPIRYSMWCHILLLPCEYYELL